jgi:Reverse transcriptase (RNA-dependent DNA polymerase)
VALKLNDYGCHVNKCYIGCILYADDIILLSASVAGLQAMLDLCELTISKLQLKFNSSKCVCICFGTRLSKVVITPMKLGSEDILWVNAIKYLGVIVRDGVKMNVDLEVVKRKFYAACNSILSNSIFQSELIRLHLLESYCLPILTYCIAVWDLTKKQVACLNVCWNMMFRKIFGFHKWESIRCCIHGLGRLDFEHIYVWLRSKCLKGYLMSQNAVVKNVMSTYRLSKAAVKFCFDHCINLDVPFHALKQQVHAMFQSTCI